LTRLSGFAAAGGVSPHHAFPFQCIGPNLR
jgi:hypothetical protein